MAFIFSDLNAITPTVTPLLVDVQAIYQSLYNILNTRKGERLFQPNFGLSLEDRLFELDDDVTAVAILQELATAIPQSEPRVTLNIAQTSVTRVVGKNEVDLVLVFAINGIPNRTFQLVGTLS